MARRNERGNIVVRMRGPRPRVPNPPIVGCKGERPLSPEMERLVSRIERQQLRELVRRLSARRPS